MAKRTAFIHTGEKALGQSAKDSDSLTCILRVHGTFDSPPVEVTLQMDTNNRFILFVRSLKVLEGYAFNNRSFTLYDPDGVDHAIDTEELGEALHRV